ncbi:nitrate- and nitrite sensing domain-containing protein [Virgisporangium ochraceum]
MAWWRVRSKLALVVAIPATAFTALATVQIAAAAADSAEVAAFHDRVELARPEAALARALQTERDRTAGELADAVREDAFDKALSADRDAVDTAYRKLADAADARAIPLGEAAELVDDLRDTRVAARTGALAPETVFQAYTSALSALFGLLPRATAGPDAALLSPTIAVQEIARAKEYASQLRARLYAACRGRFAEPATYQVYSETIAEQKAAVLRFTASAAPAVGATFGSGAGGVEAVNLRDRILEQIRGRTVSVSPQDWWRASTGDLSVLADAEQKALNQLNDDAKTLVDEHHKRTLRLTALILAVLVVTLGSWILIGRSMVRSLRDLRGQALDVAQRRLPEAIQRLRAVERQADLDNLPTTAFPQLGGSNSGDEIEEVGDAFAAVHASAVRLAGEQAELRRGANAMIVNVARRSQALVDRQLKLLDEVQGAEDDPDQLANLFRLDHLLTRMRRNDANLLVLAGADTMRRRSDPVPLSAVVLAATAEIEAYERVVTDVDDGGYISGPAVADVIHILAELLENATRYSPPDTTVTVVGRVAADGRSAYVRVADRGLGMSAEKLAEANEKIANAGQSAPVAAATAQMGLWVVGRLARRHGLTVALRGLDRGVQAEVGIPAALLAPPPSRPYAELARSVLRRSTMHLISRELAAAASVVRSRAAGGVEEGRSQVGPWGPGDQATPPYGSAAVPVTVPAPNRPDERDAANLHGWTQEIRLPAQPTATTADVTDLATRHPTNRGTVHHAPPVVPAPADGGTSGAGLPVRVPMAQLPRNPLAAPPASAASDDPAEVKPALARFYRARHRANPDDDTLA